MAKASAESTRKILANPAKFLIESGLLFEINRTVLHPVGLALCFHVDDDDKLAGIEVWDSRDDPEGYLFTEDTLKHGEEKFRKFMVEFGKEKQQERKEELGYVYQIGNVVLTNQDEGEADD